MREQRRRAGRRLLFLPRTSDTSLSVINEWYQAHGEDVSIRGEFHAAHCVSQIRYLRVRGTDASVHRPSSTFIVLLRPLCPKSVPINNSNPSVFVDRTVSPCGANARASIRGSSVGLLGSFDKNESLLF